MNVCFKPRSADNRKFDPTVIFPYFISGNFCLFSTVYISKMGELIICHFVYIFMSFVTNWQK